MKPSNPVEEIESEKGEETLEIIAKKLRHSLKSRALWLVVTLFVATILLLTSIPGFFNNSALKFKIEQKASELLSTSLTINGEVEVALFPYPAITATDVLLQNYKKDDKTYNLYAKSIQVKLSLFKFLAKDFLITRISFSDPVLETYYEANSANPRQDKFTDVATKFSTTSAKNDTQKSDSDTSLELFSVAKFQPSQFSASNTPLIEVENGTIISYDKSSRKKEIEEINGNILIDAEKIQAAGKFTNEKISNTFKLTARFNSDASKQNSVLKLDSPAMSLTIKGSFTADNRGISISDFSGKIDAEIFELRSFYKDYLSNNAAIYDKLKPNSQSIKISGDIKNNGGEIALSDIVINSNLANGKGSASLDFTGDIPRIDIDLDLENLDLDSIWSNERITTSLTIPTTIPKLADANDETVECIKKLAAAQNNTDQAANDIATDTSDKTKDPTQDILAALGKKPEEMSLKVANKIEDFDLSAEINIKNVKYLEGQIKDLDLYLTISKEGQVLILPLIFNIPGDGVVRVNGAIDNNTDLPKFIGKIDAVGKNLGETFKWLKLQSPNLKFDNLKEYTLYSDAMLFPNNITLNNFYLNLNSGQSEFLGEIKIDSSNKVTNIVNKFQVSTFNIDDFFLTSGQNVYLSSGSLLKRFLWLNDIPSTNDISLIFDKLIYKGEEFSSQSSLKFNFGQGYLKITDLTLNSQKANLQANLSIDISEKNPEFDLNIAADNFYYQTPQITKDDDAKDGKPKDFADQFFDLPSLDGFNGNISIALNSLKIDGLEIQNAKIGGKLKDGNIAEGLANCDIYGGSFKYKGLIGIKNDKTINGNLTLENASLNSLLSSLVGIKNINGTTNISANITSVANSKKEFVKGLTSEIKFNSGATEVMNYGLNDLVNKMFYFTSFRQELQSPETILFNANSRTVFKQVKGTIVLDKDKEGKFSVNLSAPAVNGILSGKIDLASNSIDSLANIIFVTGSKQKQVPLNIATAFKGDMSSLTSSSNLDQVKQYLGIIKTKPAAEAAVSNTTTLIAPTPATNASATAEQRSDNLIQIEVENQKKRAMDQINSISNPNYKAPTQ